MNKYLATFSDIDGSQSFAQAYSLIKAQFMEVLRAMNLIKIFGDFTILDFFIAILIFGAILPIVIITVNNWSSGAIPNVETRLSNRDRARKAAIEKQKQKEKQTAKTQKK